ncbi:(3,5-dihydroxyphenyl)acetyl-CoA 1,2-dioxygenase DpgC [Streptomyces sp. NPDC049687]|uniref:(3,5-dihydroxyphenyl)acetyl-CoA 1,2-dioxygenase DpgC n=1 Tax=Streptomyces sp. NPDC049687 TaxID=3365596 RepID=UPI00379F79FB
MTAAARPVWSGSPDDDARTLAELAEAGEKALAGLPFKPERSAEQQQLADRVHRACRRAREGFLARHAEHVYATLTDGLRARPRLTELAQGAADRFPGLVPTAAELAAERELPQAAKEGREIDQGLFFAAVLRSPVAGPHLQETLLRPCPRALGLAEQFRVTGSLRVGAVQVERREGAAYLTVDNPSCLNAEDNALIDDMETAVDLALLDERVKVGVLRGGVMSHPRYAGRRVFSAGINLRHLHEGRISYTDFLLRRELGYISKIYRGLAPADEAAEAALWPHRRAHKPWVAAVDTFAIGGGAQLLLVFDHVLAAADSWFSLPAAQEGIVPGAGNLRLGRHTGSRLARRILLSGAKVRACSPQAPLLFDEVVEPEAMDSALEAAVRRLGSPAVEANRRILHAVEEPDEAFRAYMAEFALEQALRLYGADVIAKVGRRAGAS